MSAYHKGRKPTYLCISCLHKHKLGALSTFLMWCYDLVFNFFFFLCLQENMETNESSSSCKRRLMDGKEGTGTVTADKENCSMQMA